ncbi:hypothetical protein [Cryobacterium glucosi]|uniref:FDXHR family putative zinc-binding protein n=1 Tax=Cryobacterium glucosi TaxID=1259175 RepID=UPI003B975DFC
MKTLRERPPAATGGPKQSRRGSDHEENTTGRAVGCVSHSKCGKEWKQRGNLTGHCAKCCETFEGLTLFDAHQLILPNGRVECRDPHSLVFHGEPIRLVEGTWRGPGMSATDLTRRLSLGNAGGIDATPGPECPPVPLEARVADQGDTVPQSVSVPTSGGDNLWTHGFHATTSTIGA